MADLVAVVQSRAENGDAGPADPRMASYLKGSHHPRHALEPRTILVAEADGVIAGYIGGHQTERFGCDGELQYLWVAPGSRRKRVASRLLMKVTSWFLEGGLRRVCVDVEPGNAAARSFYAHHGAKDLRPSWMVWDDIEIVLRKE